MYKLIAGTVEDLEEKVIEYIKAGYKPLGAPFVKDKEYNVGLGVIILIQAMAYEPPGIKKRPMTQP
jgi:hypothetical protein